MANFIVYVAYSVEQEDGSRACLYVGRSFKGLGRFAGHDTLLEQGSNLGLIELFWCADRQEAIELEKKLIREYEPSINRVRYKPGPIRVGRAHGTRLGLQMAKLETGERKSYLLKLENRLFQKWQAQASSEGKTVAYWIREACNLRLKENEVDEQRSSKNRTQDLPRAGRARLRGQRTRVASGGEHRVSTNFVNSKTGMVSEPTTAGVDYRPEHHPSCTCMVCEAQRKLGSKKGK